MGLPQVSGDEQRRLCSEKYTEPGEGVGLALSLTTYGSVAYQLKDANLEATGTCDFVCKALSIVNKTGKLFFSSILIQSITVPIFGIITVKLYWFEISMNEIQGVRKFRSYTLGVILPYNIWKTWNNTWTYVRKYLVEAWLPFEDGVPKLVSISQWKQLHSLSINKGQELGTWTIFFHVEHKSVLLLLYRIYELVHENSHKSPKTDSTIMEKKLLNSMLYFEAEKVMWCLKANMNQNVTTNDSFKTSKCP